MVGTLLSTTIVPFQVSKVFLPSDPVALASTAYVTPGASSAPEVQEPLFLENDPSSVPGPGAITFTDVSLPLPTRTVTVLLHQHGRGVGRGRDRYLRRPGSSLAVVTTRARAVRARRTAAGRQGHGPRGSQRGGSDSRAASGRSPGKASQRGCTLHDQPINRVRCLPHTARSASPWAAASSRGAPSSTSLALAAPGRLRRLPRHFRWTGTAAPDVVLRAAGGLPVTN